jgi:hypothetical protein
MRPAGGLLPFQHNELEFSARRIPVLGHQRPRRSGWAATASASAWGRTSMRRRKFFRLLGAAAATSYVTGSLAVRAQRQAFLIVGLLWVASEQW